MLVEVFAIVASVAVGLIAYYAVTNANRLLLADKDRQLAEKDKRIAAKQERIDRLENVIREMLAHKDEMSKRQNEEIEALKKKLDNKDDKAEVMLGQITDLTGDLKFEQGIFARDEALARQRQAIERIESEPNPFDDPPQQPKTKRDKK